MPATSREARAQCPWLFTKSNVRQQRPRCNKHSIIFIICLITLGFPEQESEPLIFSSVWGIIVISSLGIVRIPIGCLFWSTELANAKPNRPAKPYFVAICSSPCNPECYVISSSAQTSHFLILKTHKPDAETENNMLACTMACIGDCVIISTREFAFPYSSTDPFWRDQIQGCQIKRSADLCWLHRVMSRPRGYLQGHTKELVWSGKENQSYSRKPSN